jgi:hypothetical protein
MWKEPHFQSEIQALPFLPAEVFNFKELGPSEKASGES